MPSGKFCRRKGTFCAIKSAGFLPLSTCRNAIKSQQRQAYSRFYASGTKNAGQVSMAICCKLCGANNNSASLLCLRCGALLESAEPLTEGQKLPEQATRPLVDRSSIVRPTAGITNSGSYPFQREVSASRLGRYLVLVLFSFTVALAGWQWRKLHTLASSFWKSPATSQFRATNSTTAHVPVSSIEVLMPQSPEPSELAYAHAQSAIEETPTRDPSQERIAALASSKAQAQPVSASTRGRNNSETEGEKYLYGDGVPANCVRAQQDLLAAAEHSSAKAQSAVGTMYATGHCATRDLPLAYRWFARANSKTPATELLRKT
jgi:hypothetical protein